MKHGRIISAALAPQETRDDRRDGLPAPVRLPAIEDNIKNVIRRRSAKCGEKCQSDV